MIQNFRNKIFRRERFFLLAVSLFMLVLFFVYFVNLRSGGIIIDGFFDILYRKNNLEFGVITSPDTGRPVPKPEPDYSPRYTMLGGRAFNSESGDFIDGFAVVSIDREKYALSREGNLYAVPDIYGWYLRSGYFVYINNGLKGLRHINGKTIITARFDELFMGESFLLARYQDYHITLYYDGTEIASNAGSREILLLGNNLVVSGFPQYIVCKMFESVFIGNYALAGELHRIKILRSTNGYALAARGAVVTDWYTFAIPLSARFGYAGRFCFDNFIFSYYLYDLESGVMTLLKGQPIGLFEDRFLLQYQNAGHTLIDLKDQIAFDGIIIDRSIRTVTFSEVVFVYNFDDGSVIKEYYFEKFHLPVFYMIRPASSDFLIVSRGSGWFVIDKYGESILEPADCIIYSDGIFRVRNGDSVAFYILK